jgi:hypothetical protein
MSLAARNWQKWVMGGRVGGAATAYSVAANVVAAYAGVLKKTVSIPSPSAPKRPHQSPSLRNALTLQIPTSL